MSFIVCPLAHGIQTYNFVAQPQVFRANAMPCDHVVLTVSVAYKRGHDCSVAGGNAQLFSSPKQV
ncbi:hypothetical protein [Microcoleus sp. FACHB-672]|uniref:hypothetical protein n=1 Tax=Microcoleus sp. FACHB-672 TaxID=2692825 RepID=UPI001681DB46|nr:hypothetical protein [Microcoleus sp. FACHB-672]MBD2042746.1 hypothetical protein [Microcoleus sp. FACHB-672]